MCQVTENKTVHHHQSKRTSNFVVYEVDGLWLSVVKTMSCILISGQASVDDKAHRMQAEQINCEPFLSASDFNNFIQESDDLNDNEVRLLECARDELRRHRRWLMTDAEFLVQAKTRSFRFYCGGRLNKFICYKDDGEEPVAYLEQGGLTKKQKKMTETPTSPTTNATDLDDDGNEESGGGGGGGGGGSGGGGGGGRNAAKAVGASAFKGIARRLPILSNFSAFY